MMSTGVTCACARGTNTCGSDMQMDRRDTKRGANTVKERDVLYRLIVRYFAKENRCAST